MIENWKEWVRTNIADSQESYTVRYHKYFDALSAGCTLKEQWFSPYLTPKDRISTLEIIRDGANSDLGARDDVNLHAKLQKDIENHEMLYGIEYNPFATWKIPAHKVPTNNIGDRYVWVRFMRSFVDLETGEQTSVCLGKPPAP